jgi:hypothetical protein
MVRGTMDGLVRLSGTLSHISELVKQVEEVRFGVSSHQYFPSLCSENIVWLLPGLLRSAQSVFRISLSSRNDNSRRWFPSIFANHCGVSELSTPAMRRYKAILALLPQPFRGLRVATLFSASELLYKLYTPQPTLVTIGVCG